MVQQRATNMWAIYFKSTASMSASVSSLSGILHTNCNGCYWRSRWLTIARALIRHLRWTKSKLPKIWGSSSTPKHSLVYGHVGWCLFFAFIVWIFVTGTVTTAQFFKSCHKMIEVSRLSLHVQYTRSQQDVVVHIHVVSLTPVSTWSQDGNKPVVDSSSKWTKIFEALLCGGASAVPGGWILR